MTDQPDAIRTRRAHEFTLNRLFFGDMLLNWFLGVVMTFLPNSVDRILASSPPLLPALAYRVLGIGFLFFAAWQTYEIVKQRLGPPQLVLASVLALIPFVGLAVALVVLGGQLKPLWRAVLWFGDLYMLLLGVWYLILARWLRAEPAAGR